MMPDYKRKLCRKWNSYETMRLFDNHSSGKIGRRSKSIFILGAPMAVFLL